VRTEHAIRLKRSKRRRPRKEKSCDSGGATPEARRGDKISSGGLSVEELDTQ
jgi:hypothetical protein